MDKRSLIFVFGLTIVLFLVQNWFSSSSAPVPTKTVVEQTQEKDTATLYQNELQANLPQTPQGQEQFYVLENDYIQIVFSNFGGSIAEINLPFHGKGNSLSVVHEIEADKSVEKYSPENDYFPLLPYYRINPSNPKEVEKVEERSFGGYYPLLRRSIVGTGRERKVLRLAPQYYALSIISQDPETAKLVYKVKRFEKNLIEFEASDSHRKFTKTFTLPQNAEEAPYCYDVSIKVDGDTRGLWLTTGIPEVELISGNASPSLKYSIRKGSKTVVEQVDLPKTSSTFSSIAPDWICNSNGFFGIILNPLTEINAGFSAFHLPGTTIPTRLSLIDPDYDLYPAEKYPGYELQLPLRSSSQKMDFRIFAGPFDDDILRRVDATYTDPITGYSPNYVACQTFHGWFSFISEPFANFLFFLMKFFHKITYSWGISIILLTLALRIMLYPLNNWSIKSMLGMQAIAPQVTAIQERHKKDPKKAQLEIMNLYKEKGVNPLTGCFPLLIQMPFLIGMFDLLKSTFELRGVSFIPGWIDNLTAPDVVFSWNYPLFFFGTEFHLLPILLGAVMFIQQKYSSTAPKDKNLLTDQQKQQRTMGNVMTVVFTVMFYHFPSGLNIYWLSSMLLGILQQWWTMKKFKAKEAVSK